MKKSIKECNERLQHTYKMIQMNLRGKSDSYNVKNDYQLNYLIGMKDQELQKLNLSDSEVVYVKQI